MLSQVRRFLQDDSGPTAAEYGVLLALILLALISAVTAVGSSTSGLWSTNVNQITSASS